MQYQGTQGKQWDLVLSRSEDRVVMWREVIRWFRKKLRVYQEIKPCEVLLVCKLYIFTFNEYSFEKIFYIIEQYSSHNAWTVKIKQRTPKTMKATAIVLGFSS